MKKYVDGSITQSILNLGIRWKRVSSFTHWLLYLQEKIISFEVFLEIPGCSIYLQKLPAKYWHDVGHHWSRTIIALQRYLNGDAGA
jgi:hypothetical protein